MQLSKYLAKSALKPKFSKPTLLQRDAFRLPVPVRLLLDFPFCSQLLPIVSAAVLSGSHGFGWGYL